MILMENLVHTPLAQALGWTLFHSLWEGAVAAMLLAAALSVVRSSRIRYALACLAMLGILAGFAFTLARSLPEPFAKLTTTTRAIGHAATGEGRFPDLSVNRRIADVLPWLTPFWILGVILFHLRCIVSWTSARRLRRKGVCSAPEGWQQRLDQLSARLRVTKSVALLETVFSEAPVVIGWLRPVILFPVGLLAGMSAAQIEAILIHELAHIRRRDYLANLLQTVVEGFLFYHPAVWWISGVIRAERENCCDDLVVAVNGNAHEYATALTALEETRWDANQAALAVTGGVLMRRIRRLLYPKESPRAFLTPLLSAGMLIIVAALALTAWQSKPADSPTQQATADFFQRWLNEDVSYIITPRGAGCVQPAAIQRGAREVHRSVLVAPRPHARHGRKRIQRRALPADVLCQSFRITVGHAGLEDRSRQNIYHVRPTGRNRLASRRVGRQISL